MEILDQTRRMCLPGWGRAKSGTPSGTAIWALSTQPLLKLPGDSIQHKNGMVGGNDVQWRCEGVGGRRISEANCVASSAIGVTVRQ